jgi:hypothetical protein
MPDTSYYTKLDADADLLNVERALNLQLMQYFANLLFNGDLTKMLYASNKYCFRYRTDQNKGVLSMPFMNVFSSNLVFDNTYSWYTSTGDREGVYVEELQSKVHVMPVKLTYEANLWFERDDDAKVALQRLLFLRDNHTRFEFGLTLKNQARTVSHTMTDIAVLNFSEIDMGGNYNETDWLTQNQIRNVVVNFTANTFILKSTFDVFPVDTVIFEFTKYYAGQENYADMTFEEQYQFVVDHVLDTVTPAP